jgi:RNA polymerase sigma-70 factor, ECF subfamily
VDLVECYERCGATLFRRAVAWLGERASAEDAVHAVFARLVERGSGGIADLESYLHVALTNELHRLAKRRAPEAFDPTQFFHSETARRDGVDRVQHALATLPPEQREVVVLHVYADLTFDRIATLLAISPNTVASRYRYAREKLSKVLDEPART